MLEKLESVTPADLAILTSLFNDAEKKQDQLLTKIVKYDDTFVTRLKHFIKNEIRKFHGGVEKAQRKKEKVEEILKEIE